MLNNKSGFVKNEFKSGALLKLEISKESPGDLWAQEFKN